MKTLTQKMTKTLTTIVLTLSTIGVANASTKFVAADDYLTSKLCVVAAQGSRIQLRSMIKESGFSAKHIAKNVTCNDQNIVEFVQDHAENPNKINRLLMGGKYRTQVNITDLAAN